MRKLFLTILIVFLSILNIFALDFDYAPDDEDFVKAIEFYERKYYEKAVEHLLLYIDRNPQDEKASEFLENLYGLAHRFKVEYIKGREFYNKRLFYNALVQFNKAFEFGNSDRLQFMFTETKRNIFKIQNTFAEMSLVETQNGFVLNWAKGEYFSKISGYILSDDNLQLLNAAYIFNKNEILVPGLIEYFADKIVGTFESDDTQVFIPRNRTGSFLIIIYPRTEDWVMGQPRLKLIPDEEFALNTNLILEYIKKVEILPVFTNTNFHSIFIEKSERTPNEKLYNNFETDNDIDIDLFEDNIIAQKPDFNETQEKDKNGLLWQLILFLLMLLIIIARILCSKYGEKIKNKSRETSIYKLLCKKSGKNKSNSISKKNKDIQSKPQAKKPDKNKGNTGKVIKIFIILTALSIFIAAADLTALFENHFDLETIEWIHSIIGTSPKVTTAQYDFISGFYSYEKGIELKDYAETLKFVEMVAQWQKKISEDYFNMNDYENFALTSFMAYYLGKDYPFFSSSLNKIREENRRRIGNTMYDKSRYYERQGLYLNALIRLTGSIALSESFSQERFNKITELTLLHKQQASRIESIYVRRRISDIILSVNLSPVEKNIYSLIETQSALSNFSWLGDITELNNTFSEALKENRNRSLYNTLTSEAEKVYRNRNFDKALEIYELLKTSSESGEPETIKTN